MVVARVTSLNYSRLARLRALMSLPSQARLADEKLGLILGQLGSVRRRLNSLAWQHALFFTIAIAVAVAAVAYAGAYLLSPLMFLLAAALAIFLGTIGLVATARTAWRMRASAAFAAALADDRGELKGRLSTIVALAGREHQGSLWAYLVEDTLSRREHFAPARIERRRVSRAVFALAGALMLALLALPLSRIRPSPRIAIDGGQDDLTIDLNDLHLRPAAPGDESGMQVTADPETMRKLQEKLVRENIADGDKGGNSLNHLFDQAREMAGRFQNKLTGQQQPKQRLNLRLADAGPNSETGQIRRAPDQPGNRRKEVAGQFQQDPSLSKQDLDLPPVDDTKHVGTQAQGKGGDHSSDLGGGKDNSGNQNSASTDDAQQSGDSGTSGGVAHGIGADPESLFGAPATAKLGTEGFEIAIEARPIEHGATGAGHAYTPPKVRTPLSAEQAPDEPLARAAVPSEDRATIKRVFER
jgi:hypothetical protein